MRRVVGAILFCIVMIAVLLVLISVDRASHSKETTMCDNPNPCRDCPVVISCLNMEHHGAGPDNVWFQVENRKNTNAECVVELVVVQDEIELTESRHVGVVPAQSSISYETQVRFPSGSSDLEVNPRCTW